MLDDNKKIDVIDEVDNRDCGNESCCDKKPLPNVSMYSYNFIKNCDVEDDKNCDDKKETKCELLNKIRCLSFAIVELAQYLDTHVDDKKAIKLHKEYANALHDLKNKYQKVYGPLTLDFPCNKWRWIEEPWPWERGNC